MHPKAPASPRSGEPAPAAGPNRWTIPDLIDLDHYIERDEETLRVRPAARLGLVERDRALYLGEIAPALDGLKAHTPEHRRTALLRWLRLRRAADGPERLGLLPGATFALAERLVRVALALAGVLIGSAVASALLRYDGTHPVNVAWYVFLLVIPQIVLVAGLGLAWLLGTARPAGRAAGDLTLLGRLIRPAIEGLALRLLRRRLAQTAREAQGSAQGRVAAYHALYGGIPLLPVLVAAQVFAVAFNLGALVTTLALVWFTDLAFGWGSTLDLGPQTIHDLARAIAWPWGSLFGEGVGYPSLEQIAGSRINLKDPLRLAEAADLRSWRWFLILALACYGLLPRLLVLGIGVLARRRLLARLPLTHARAQALYARLVSPHLEIGTVAAGSGVEMPIPGRLVQAQVEAPAECAAPAGPAARAPGSHGALAPVPPAPAPTPPEAEAPAPEPGPIPRLESSPASTAAPAPSPAPVAPKPTPGGPPAPRPATGGIAGDACLLLVHVDVDDCLGELDRPRLAGMLLDHSGWRVARRAAFGAGAAMTESAMALVAGQAWEDPPPRLAVVMDGSQPPITETLRLLRGLRSAAGAQAQILLALVGDPQDEDPLPPVRDFDLVDWQRKIEALGDPYLRLERLALPQGTDRPRPETRDGR